MNMETMHSMQLYVWAEYTIKTYYTYVQYCISHIIRFVINDYNDSESQDDL